MLDWVKKQPPDVNEHFERFEAAQWDGKALITASDDSLSEIGINGETVRAAILQRIRPLRPRDPYRGRAVTAPAGLDTLKLRANTPGAVRPDATPNPEPARKLTKEEKKEAKKREKERKKREKDERKREKKLKKLGSSGTTSDDIASAEPKDIAPFNYMVPADLPGDRALTPTSPNSEVDLDPAFVGLGEPIYDARTDTAAGSSPSPGTQTPNLL